MIKIKSTQKLNLLKKVEIIANLLSKTNKTASRSKLANIYGLEMSFVATRSGLTRVRVYDLSVRIKKLADLFIQRHNKATDEAWYSRTVDWNMRFNEDATIITVPYNAYIRLVAKLRQRITQRHPAVNDTRANCDPQLAGGDAEEPAGGTSTEPTGDTLLLSSTGPPPAGAASVPTSLTDESLAKAVEASMTTEAGASKPANGIQNDEPTASSQQETQTGQTGQSEQQQQQQPQEVRIDYNAYSTFDFLDLLANSSVHVSATQSVIPMSGTKQRSPVAVTGLLYDYATFARRFLNSTSLNIKNLDAGSGSNNNNGEQQVGKVDICPNGECPTKCGYRNDTIDCLLIDNNGFIVVGEELPYIGRQLSVYDEKLMQSLVDKHVFHQITLIDYQAICTRSAEQVAADQKAAAAAVSNFNNNNMGPPLATQISSAGKKVNSFPGLSFGVTSLLANAASSLAYTATVFYSMLTYKSTTTSFLSDLETAWTGEPTGQLASWLTSSPTSAAVDAQSAIANQSLLAMLPNKTYLRPCERTVTLYETRPPSEKFASENQKRAQGKTLSQQAPEYYETKCNCSGWYVYEQVPKTNLILLVVNTTSACRRGCDFSSQYVGAPNILQQASGGVADPASNFIPVPIPVELPASLPVAITAANSSLFGGGNKTAEDLVCSMLERDSQLYVMRTPPEACYAFNQEEYQIPLCGGAQSNYQASISSFLKLLSLVFSTACFCLYQLRL